MFIVNLAISDICMITTQGLPCTINAFASDHWMFGPVLCRVYGCLGGIFGKPQKSEFWLWLVISCSIVLGTASLMTMVVLGYDRYNVIVKGIQASKITSSRAVVILAALWVFSSIGGIPPFFGWGDYKLEGLFLTCSYDYLTDEWNHKSFMIYAFVCHYVLPMSAVIFFYSQIVIAVVTHEAKIRAQAKKMNVDSLRSNANQGDESAELKIGTLTYQINVQAGLLTCG